MMGNWENTLATPVAGGAGTGVTFWDGRGRVLAR
jgi:hypothetical protein